MDTVSVTAVLRLEISNNTPVPRFSVCLCSGWIWPWPHFNPWTSGAGCADPPLRTRACLDVRPVPVVVGTCRLFPWGPVWGKKGGKRNIRSQISSFLVVLFYLKVKLDLNLGERRRGRSHLQSKISFSVWRDDEICGKCRERGSGFLVWSFVHKEMLPVCQIYIFSFWRRRLVFPSSMENVSCPGEWRYCCVERHVEALHLCQD